VSFHGVTMVMEDEGWEMRTKGKIRRWNMIIPLWSVVRNGGDALGNDRESGKDGCGILIDGDKSSVLGRSRIICYIGRKEKAGSLSLFRLQYIPGCRPQSPFLSHLR